MSLLKTETDFQKFDNVPLVSVVTVVFNGDEHLQTAIDSLRSQTYPSIEYLIIDGGSTDRTLDVVRSNTDVITDWVSEPDEGIYDAMNKGIARAKGEYIALLNADDLLLPDGLEVAISALEKLPEPGYTCGAVELIEESGKRVGVTVPFTEQIRVKRRFMEIPCPHLGVVVHRSVYEKAGVFDTSFQLSADYDLLLRFIRLKIPCAHLPSPIGQFRSGGVSGGLETWKETYRVLRKHGHNRLRAAYPAMRSAVKSSIGRMLPVRLRKLAKTFLQSKNQYD